MRSPRLSSIIAVVLTALSLSPDHGWSAVEKQAAAFFEKHCLECHDSEMKKGGLNLEKVDYTMAGKVQTDRWTGIYDRVAKGEMPPAKKPRPDAKELDQVLAAIKPQLLSADHARREVVQRRLNRIEYQNTIQDLLAVDVELTKLLPEDQRAGGFDNNGEALAVSTEQMQGYLQAARRAVDAAIVNSERPTTETFKVDSLNEVRPYLGQGGFDLMNGRIVTYTSSDDSSYSKISTRGHRIPVRGRYRFRFQAAKHDTQDALYFTVAASTFSGLEATHRNLGYYELGPEPKMFEVEAVLDAKSAIQFFAIGLPTYLKKKPGTLYAGVGFGEVEVTGPLIDQWPPESHTRLLGTTDLKTGTLADAERILRSFVPRAFRRAVTDEEVTPYLALVRARLDSGRGFDESLRVGLVAALCSPNFIYLREEPEAKSARISDIELASRLSYFIHSTQPDGELMDLANRKQLSAPAALRAQVERLLKSPKIEAFIKNFTGQWLHLRQINDTTPDAKLYKNFDELLQVSMLWESEGFFREMLNADAPVEDMLDSKWAMLNKRLADHYGIEGVQGLALRKVTLPAESVRGGVLTQAAVLKVTANGTTTSPVLRGVWVLENILGQPTPPPPPNTAGIEPDIRGATTVREQLAKHRNTESCNSCHSKIDPPGFALESFDPIGANREKYLRWIVTNAEHNWGRVDFGAAVDPSGRTANNEAFANIREFKKLLLNRREDFARCLTEKLMTYALGRELGFSDRDAVSKIVAEANVGGNGLRTLIHAIVQSETFATR